MAKKKTKQQTCDHCKKNVSRLWNTGPGAAWYCSRCTIAVRRQGKVRRDPRLEEMAIQEERDD